MDTTLIEKLEIVLGTFLQGRVGMREDTQRNQETAFENCVYAMGRNKGFATELATVTSAYIECVKIVDAARKTTP